MKTVRGYAHDFGVLQEMHRLRPFDLETLVTRFQTEIGQSVTDHRLFRLNFEVFLERAFGKSTAAPVRDELERAVQKRDPGLYRRTVQERAGALFPSSCGAPGRSEAVNTGQVKQQAVHVGNVRPGWRASCALELADVQEP